MTANLGASLAPDLGEHTEPTVRVEILTDWLAVRDGGNPYYARVVGGSDHAGFCDSTGLDPETARRKALSRYRRRRLGVEYQPGYCTPDDALNPLAGQVANNGHRFALWRRIGPGERIACWIMLNPSTADATTDDATMRRVCSFSRSWGYDWVTIGNLWPYRATQPAALHEWIATSGEFVGRAVAESDRWVRDMATRADLVIAAWGTHGRAHGREAQMLALLDAHGIRPHALAITRDGAPRHPLRLSATLRPQPLAGLRAIPAAPLHVLDQGMTYLVYRPPSPRPVFVTNSRPAAARRARAEAFASVLGVGHGRARWVRFSGGRRAGEVVENPADVAAYWVQRAMDTHGAPLLPEFDWSRFSADAALIAADYSDYVQGAAS